jgi:hypothetical protein
VSPFSSIWTWFAGDKVVLPTQARIDDTHVDVLAAGAHDVDLTANRCYFVVHVNEMFLRDRSVWWKDYVPTLWTATQFGYDGAVQEVPALVGPSLLEGNDLGVPEGMLFRNTRVAGLHPYRGGPVSFSLILNRVEAKDHVQSVLSIVESASGAFSLAMNLTPYLAVARTVTRGLEVLMDLGSAPVMGMRDTLSPDVGASPGLGLGYYALLEERIPPARLWVREGGLFVGDTAEHATPVRDRSYVLYNIASSPRRNDVDQLTDLRELRGRVEEFAQRPGDDSWLTAKTSMTELGVRLRTHPDLITPQADELFREWVTDMVKLHEERVAQAPRWGEQARLAKLSNEQADIQDISLYVMNEL